MKPNFFAHVARQKGYYNPQKKFYKHHETTMDHLQKILLSVGRERPLLRFLPFSAIVSQGSSTEMVDYDEVERIFSMVYDTKRIVSSIWATEEWLLPTHEKYVLASTAQQDCINYVDSIRLTRGTMRYLLLKLESPENKSLQRSLLYALFGAPNKSFYKLIRESADVIDTIKRSSEPADFCLFGLNFKRILHEKRPIPTIKQAYCKLTKQIL